MIPANSDVNAVRGALFRRVLSIAASCAIGLASVACGGGASSSATGSDDQAASDNGQNSPVIGDARVGVIGPKGDWPLVPIHMGLMPDGRLVSFGRESNLASEMIYDVWDYREGLSSSSHLTLPNRSGTDLFCANQLLLSNGLLLMTGGDTRKDATDQTVGYQTGEGNADATVFDPVTNQITRRGTMNEPRWYGTMTKLPSGEVFIQGGSTTTLADRAHYVEIASSDGRLYRSLQGFDVYDLPWLYPRNFVDRSGQITGWAKKHSYRINPGGAGSRTDFGLAPQVMLEDGGLAVMYRPGKVLLAGGRSTRAIRADINHAIPVYESVPDMSSPRIWGTATVLPSGDVLATNGGSNDSSAAGADLGNPAYHVSIYNPESNTWKRGPSSGFARLYHSASILLPDATVLLGGGGLPGPVTNLNAEIYFPAYLFDSNGEFAERPQLLNAPTVLDPAAKFVLTVSPETEVSRVVLVKTGAVTHSFDMDQRFVELSFERTGGQINARLPVHAADTTPGFYHLFVLNPAGVPSLSHVLRINEYSGQLPAFAAAGPVTDTVNGNWPDAERAPFELVCASDEVLVGVHGDIDGNLAAAGPVCAKADSSGAGKLGASVFRPPAGRLTRPGAPRGFVSTCAANQAVSGFRGRADQTVIGIELVCRTVADVGRLTGESTVMAPVGQKTDSAPVECPAAKPAVGVRGETETRFSQITRLGLRCAA